MPDVVIALVYYLISPVFGFVYVAQGVSGICFSIAFEFSRASPLHEIHCR
jgi:hypothetical protein